METTMMLKNVRVSFPHVFNPAAVGDSVEKKYSCSFLINKDDTETVAQINKIIEHLKKEAQSKFYDGKKVPGNFKTPLRDGDSDRDDEAYANHWFMNASSKSKPGVIDRAKNPITEESESFYAGCYAYATVNFYLFNANGNRGIACGLNNIMKVRDGERLAGKRDAASDFAEVEVGDDDLFGDDALLG